MIGWRPFSRIPGAKSTFLVPMLLPFGLDQVKRILFASRCHKARQYRGNMRQCRVWTEFLPPGRILLVQVDIYPLGAVYTQFRKLQDFHAAAYATLASYERKSLRTAVPLEGLQLCRIHTY